MRLPSICLSLLCLFLTCSGASAQCTSCDGDVKVRFKGALCINGTYTLQLHDKTIGPVTGTTCGVYTHSPEEIAKLKPEKSYDLEITTIPNTNGVSHPSMSP